MFLEFIEAVNNEMVMVLSIVSMKIEKEYLIYIYIFSKEKGDTLIVIVTTRQSMDLVGLQIEIVSIHSQYVYDTYFVWLCF